MGNFGVLVTDPILIADVLNGQKDQFKELILRYQKMVFAVAWSYLGNVELAEEAAQQTFVKAYSSLASLDDATKFRSWLAAIARNASVSIGRTRRRELSNSMRWDIDLLKCPAEVYPDLDFCLFNFGKSETLVHPSNNLS